MLRPMQRSQPTTQTRAALFEGARAPGAAAGSTKGSSVYDDETAKMLESSNNKQQEELHKKLLMLKSVRSLRCGVFPCSMICAMMFTVTPECAARQRFSWPFPLVLFVADISPPFPDQARVAPHPPTRAGQVTQDMHGEILSHNRLLSGMQEDMSATNNSLQASLQKLGALVTGGGSLHVCHLVAFCVAVFLLLYWLFLRK